MRTWVTGVSPLQVRRSTTRHGVPSATLKARATSLRAAAALMRCSARVHGTRCTSQAPGDSVDERLVGGVGRRGEADQPVLEAERPLRRVVAAGQGEEPRVGADGEARAVGARRAPFRSGDDGEAIGQAERGDFGLDVGDFQHRRLRMRPDDEAAGLAPPLDQPGAGELSERLADGHARAAVLRRQLVLEGDPPSGRPFARQDVRLDVGEDAPMQRAAAFGATGWSGAHGASRRIAAA